MRGLNMKYYLHRISHESEVSYALFMNGVNGNKYISLGWSSFLDTDILDCARKNDGYKSFDNCYLSKRKDKIRNRWNMWYFAQFSKGDIVIVPLYDGKFAVCEVIEQAKSIRVLKDSQFKCYWSEKDVHWEDNAFHCDNKKIDLGFVVKVKILHNNVSRNNYANSDLTSRLKMRQTNGSIDDIKQSVKETIKALDEKKPINFYDNSIDNLVPLLQERLDKDLNPDKFELLVKRYMEKLGANAFISPKNQAGKEDYADADVIAYFDNINVAILIQAKHHKSETDGWAVEQIKKYKEQLESPDYPLDDGVNGYTYILWVISTCSGYTEEAKKLAKDNNVKLINGKDFAKMILQQGLQNIDLN